MRVLTPCIYRRALLPLTLVVLGLSHVSAQWSVIDLSPSGYSQSWASGIGSGQQCGSVQEPNGLSHAGYWSGTAASWIDLNPPGAQESDTFGVQGGQQVGRVVGHAALWSGSAESYVDLNPGGAHSSWAFAVHSGRQVGRAEIGNTYRAGMWSGTAASWVDLSPGFGGGSYALGIDANQQVGVAVSHAALWYGTASSRVDLNPAGALVSLCYGVGQGQQVGVARYGAWDGPDFACYWSGSASTYVNLHPAGATSSYAYAAASGMQVGAANINGQDHASLWYGTAESRVDLNAFLPAEYTSAQAFGISTVGDNIYIVGGASAPGKRNAIMWVSTVPELQTIWFLAIPTVLICLRTLKSRPILRVRSLR